MRKIFAVIVLAGLALAGFSAPGDKKSPWLTSFEEAKSKAAKEDKLILADFSGSDWCGWCIKLEKEVFSKKEFLDAAAQNYVLLLVDFPRSQTPPKENYSLAEKYDVDSFPNIVILSPDGKVVDRKSGYMTGGPDAYIKYLKEVFDKYSKSKKEKAK
jgi:thioredoxin-related protein